MHTLVIGGGVVGLTTAYHLKQNGHNVTVLDSRGMGQGASDVNAGWLVPACAAPVPGPGMVKQSLKWMTRPDSPLYIKPSLQPDFVRFMLGMWRQCNGPAQRRGFQAHLKLMGDSLSLFDDYATDGIDFEMRSNGLLMAFLDERGIEAQLKYSDLFAEHGLDPQVLRGDAVREQEPLLSDGVVGGIYFSNERNLDPSALMSSLYKRVRALGVEIVEHRAVQGVTVSDGRVTAVRGGDEFHTPDSVVLATGAWTGETSKLFGARLPVRPGKGYTVDVDPLPLRSAINLSDSKVAVGPLSDRLRLAGTMEFGGLDENINQARVDAVLRAPARYFRDWEPPSRRITPGVGMRPMTPDGMPLIGRLPGLSNAYVSTGHGMLGLTLAPASARALADLITTGIAPDVIQPFNPARFG